jgi:hypothetical protein
MSIDKLLFWKNFSFRCIWVRNSLLMRDLAYVHSFEIRIFGTGKRFYNRRFDMGAAFRTKSNT